MKQADTVEDTTMGDSARTHIVTLTSFDGSLDVYWDETDTNGQVALGVGSSVTLDLYPEGEGAGATYYTGTASVTSVNKSSSFDGMVEQSISVQGNGPLNYSDGVMANLIDQAVAHFSSREIRKMNVPEWEVDVYAKNLSTRG